MKKFICFSCVIVLFLSLCSCSNNSTSLEAGDFVSDTDIISDGRFDHKEVALNGQLFSSNRIYSYFEDSYYRFIVFDDLSSDFFLVSFDLDGKNTSVNELKTPLIYENNTLIPTSDPEGFFTSQVIDSFLMISYSVPFLFFDSNGNICGVFEVYGESVGEETTSYLCKNFLFSWDVNGEIISVTDVIPDDLYNDSDATKSWALTNTGIIYYDSEGNYLYDYFNYINSSFSESLISAEIADDDHFCGYFFQPDGSLVFNVFTRKNDKISTSITPISIYCTCLDDSIKNEIFAYNEKNKGYRIGVKDYSVICRNYILFEEDDEIRHAALMSLQNDILSGDTPDMIFDMGGLDYTFVNALASFGFAADVSKLIEKDSEIKDSGFVINIPGINGCYEYDSVPTYVTIVSFKYCTYIGSLDNEDIRRGWNMTDLISLRNKLGPDAVVIDTLTSRDFLKKALKFNGFSWVDIENKASSFNCDEYIRVLEYSKSLPGSLEEFTDLAMNGQIPVNIFSFERAIGNLDEFYLYGSRILYSNPVNIGFPSDYGNGKVIVPDCSFIINKNSASTDFCWEFGKNLLSAEYQDSLYESVPILNSSFEIWRNNTLMPDTSADRIILIDGQPHIIGQMPDDQADECVRMIRNCNNLYFEDPFIEDIVLNIASEYFDGKITVDEAAERTEKEVNDYLVNILSATS